MLDFVLDFVLAFVLALLIFIVYFAVMLFFLRKNSLHSSRIGRALLEDLERCRDLNKRREND